MDTLGAMKETMEEANAMKCFSPEKGPTSYLHLTTMHTRAQTGNFSEGKINRWLGWMQCAVVSWGASDLESMKHINMKHKDT